MNNEVKSQREKIIDYLKAGNRITGLVALDKFGCYGGFRARCAEIRKIYPNEFKSEFIKLDSGKMIKSYWLEFKQPELF